MIKVCKFGGSSLADASQFKKVKDIINSDSLRQVIVVSAPGKRNKEDNKITDLLYLLHAHLRYGVDYTSIYNSIKNRYIAIRDELGLNFAIEYEFDLLEKEDSEYKYNHNLKVNLVLIPRLINYSLRSF